MDRFSVSLVAVGEAMVDVFASLRPATDSPSHGRIRLLAGGTPVNAARAAVSLGATAAVVARVGADPAGGLIRDALDELAIAHRLAVDPEQPTGVFVETPGGIVADRGANNFLSIDDVADLPLHEALLVSGYTLREPTLAAANHALETSPGRWRAVDAGGAPSGIHPAGANVIFGTAGELGNDTDRAEDTALRLGERFEIAVVKLGADGAVAARGGTVVARRPPTRAAGSSTGAGDVLDAAFLVGLIRGLELGDALQLAVETAAASIDP